MYVPLCLEAAQSTTKPVSSALRRAGPSGSSTQRAWWRSAKGDRRPRSWSGTPARTTERCWPQCMSGYPLGKTWPDIGCFTNKLFRRNFGITMEVGKYNATSSSTLCNQLRQLSLISFKSYTISCTARTCLICTVLIWLLNQHCCTLICRWANEFGWPKVFCKHQTLY